MVAERTSKAGSLLRGDGVTLPDELWEARHAWLLRILYLHVPVLLAVALAFGYSVTHALQEAAAVLVLAVIATHVKSRCGRALLVTTALLSCSALLVHFTGGLSKRTFTSS